MNAAEHTPSDTSRKGRTTMQLNITTDYALRALIYLSGQERTCNSQSIGEYVSVSGEYIRKILRMLKAAGMVISDQGAFGGYKLAKPLSEITLLDVLQVTEDTVRITRRAEKARGNDENDPLLRLYNDTQAWVDRTLSSITLQDIVDGKETPFTRK